jgi:hypothetical protein
LGLEMKGLMQTRTVAILTVTLAMAVFLSAGPAGVFCPITVALGQYPYPSFAPRVSSVNDDHPTKRLRSIALSF